MSGWRLLRRGSVASLIAAACVAGHAHGDEAAAAARLPGRVALLARAQDELERGDASAALDDFERAAMMLHAADAELGLIRAAMQDGQYRRALAFCAHTAGEHTDDADGAALYAWLLRIGGQGELATRTLAEARALAPGDAIAAAVDEAFAKPALQAQGLLLASLHRMAPWPVMVDAQAPPPAAVRFAGTATLLADGATALVPLATFDSMHHDHVWVRNGLGQATEAMAYRGDRYLTERGLVLLKLRSPLSVGASRQAVGAAPFAGSPGYAVAFSAGAGPAWPQLAQGFLGSLVGQTDVRRLGFDAPAGSPVLDRRGALVGVAVAAPDGQATWVPLSALPLAPSATPSTAAASAAPATGLVASDEIYESGMRRALQVLVDSP